MAEKIYLSNCNDKVDAELALRTDVRKENRFSRPQIDALKDLGVITEDYDIVGLVISMSNGLHREMFSIVPKGAKTIITDKDVIMIEYNTTSL